MGYVDLAKAPIVDAHCHGFRVDEIRSRDPGSFETRFTLLGACWVLGTDEDPRTTWDYAYLQELTEHTMQTMAVRRWLAAYLGCEPTKAALAAARSKALASDAKGYINGLFRDQTITGLLIDRGTPGYIPHEELDELFDIPVYRAFRLETWIAELQEKGYDGFVPKLLDEAEKVVKHPRMVAFKSFIQFYTGGDIGDPSEQEARAAYAKWQAAGFKRTAELAKPVWDFILQRVMDIAKREGKALHFHVGAEGNDPVIGRPFDFYPFLKQHDDQPIVLIHSGYPWVNETAYLAGTFLNVYLDLSEITLWAPGQIRWVMEMLLGWVPTAKILYGSDACVEPEQFWIGAKFFRPILARVLDDMVAADHLTKEQAQQVGENVLAGNVARLHGFPVPPPA